MDMLTRLATVVAGPVAQFAQHAQQLVQQDQSNEPPINVILQPGPKRVFNVLAFKFLGAWGLGLCRYVILSKLASLFGLSKPAVGIATVASQLVGMSSSLFLAYSVETRVPLFVAIIAFVVLVLVGLVISMFGCLLQSLLVASCGIVLVDLGSVAIQPWLTVFAADQLPKVSAQERSVLFMYSFTCMYLATALANATGPYIMWLLGESGAGALVLAAALVACGLYVFLLKSREYVVHGAGSGSMLVAVGTCLSAVGYNTSPLSPGERDAINEAVIAKERSLDPSLMHGSTDRWLTWVDRAYNKVNTPVWSLTRLFVMLSPFAAVLMGFGAVFGTLELQTLQDGADADRLRYQPVSVAISRPVCLSERELQVVKALYAVVMVPALELLVLPMLWSSERASRPTPLRRMVLGMFSASLACAMTGLMHALASWRLSLLACVVQIVRTSMVVVAEVLVGGAWVEFAYACGATSFSARIASVSYLFIAITIGELLSDTWMTLWSYLLPTSLVFILLALGIGVLGFILVPRAWPGLRVGSMSGANNNSSRGDSENTHHATGTLDRGMFGGQVVVPGAEPEDEHVPVTNTAADSFRTDGGGGSLRQRTARGVAPGR